MLKKYMIIFSMSLIALSTNVNADAIDKGINLGKNKEVIYYKSSLNKDLKIEKSKVVIDVTVKDVKQACFNEDGSQICIKYGFGKIYEIVSFTEILTKRNFEKNLKEYLDKGDFKSNKSAEIKIPEKFYNIYENKDYIYAYELVDLNYNYLLTTVALNKEMQLKEQIVKEDLNSNILKKSFSYFK